MITEARTGRRGGGRANAGGRTANIRWRIGGRITRMCVELAGRGTNSVRVTGTAVGTLVLDGITGRGTLPRSDG